MHLLRHLAVLLFVALASSMPLESAILTDDTNFNNTLKERTSDGRCLTVTWVSPQTPGQQMFDAAQCQTLDHATGRDGTWILMTDKCWCKFWADYSCHYLVAQHIGHTDNQVPWPWIKDYSHMDKEAYRVTCSFL